MTPIKLLQLVSKELINYPDSYAVAGGFAASLYRKQPRMTNDIDIAFCVGNRKNSLKIAKQIIASLGFKSAMGWIHSEDKLSDPIALVIGRPSQDEFSSTIDLLLPTLPWVESSIKRAQDNIIDFGFAKLPTITPEDLILAKAFALSIEKNRFVDMDDIQSIFAADNELDLLYLREELRALGLNFPKALKNQVPKLLRRIQV